MEKKALKSRVYFTSIFLICVLTVIAQDLETARGFGALEFQVYPTKGNLVVESGGRGALFFDDRILIGGGGYGQSWKDDGNEYSLGYGGPLLGVNLFSKKSISISVSSLIGYGKISIEQGNSKFSSTLWLLKPQLEFEFTLLEKLKVGPTLGYRAILNKTRIHHSLGISNDLYCGISLKFGNWK